MPQSRIGARPNKCVVKLYTGTPAPTADELFGFNWNGQLNGTTTIVAATGLDPTNPVQLNVRSPQSGIPLITTNLNLSQPSTTLALPSLVTVSGRVEAPGRQLGYGSVQLLPVANPMFGYNATIQPDGTFSIQVQAGDYLTAANVSLSTGMTMTSNTSFSYAHRARSFAADTVLDNIVFNTTTHDVTVLNANGTPATNLSGDISEGVSAYNYVWTTPAPTADELFGFNWNGQLNGTTTIVAATGLDPTNPVQLNVRSPQSGIPLITTNLNLASILPTVILLTGGSGGVVIGSGDNDGDNVADAIEALAPDTDINNDQVLDFQQDNVTSLPILGEQTGQYVSLESLNSPKLSNVRTIPPDAIPGGEPAGATFPFGLVQFELPQVTANSDQTIRIYVQSTTGITGYAKYHHGVWSTLPADRVDIQPTYIEIRITDNGVGDDDLTEGQIADPGAPMKGSLDSTPPTITCPSAPTFILKQPGATLTAALTDAGGIDATSVTVPVPTIAAVLAGSVPVTAIDRTGNTATAACPFNVSYRFDGFREPVSPSPTVNTVKTGSTVPVKWRITDWNGVGVSDPASFKALTSSAAACTTSATDEVEVINVGSGLNYLGDGTWQYNWKTSGLPTGCRQLRLLLNGAASPQTAQFKVR